MAGIKPRKVLKVILSRLAVLVLKKHKPDVILVTGAGETSVVRECLYTLLYEQFPTRRTLEFPEAEFGIPLTVFGELKYPSSSPAWLAIILKVLIQQITVKPYKHILILEISNLSREFYFYWAKILNPKFVIDVKAEEDFLTLTSPTYYSTPIINDVLQNYKISQDYIENQLKKVNLPISKIKLSKGQNGSTVIDARHYYYPPPLSSVTEITEAMPGRKIIYTSLKADLEELAKLKEKWLINPKNFQPIKDDVIVVRGNKKDGKSFDGPTS